MPCKYILFENWNQFQKRILRKKLPIIAILCKFSAKRSKQLILLKLTFLRSHFLESQFFWYQRQCQNQLWLVVAYKGQSG